MWKLEDPIRNKSNLDQRWPCPPPRPTEKKTGSEKGGLNNLSHTCTYMWNRCNTEWVRTNGQNSRNDITLHFLCAKCCNIFISTVSPVFARSARPVLTSKLFIPQNRSIDCPSAVNLSDFFGAPVSCASDPRDVAELTRFVEFVSFSCTLLARPMCSIADQFYEQENCWQLSISMKMNLHHLIQSRHISWPANFGETLARRRKLR